MSKSVHCTALVSECESEVVVNWAGGCGVINLLRSRHFMCKSALLFDSITPTKRVSPRDFKQTQVKCGSIVDTLIYPDFLR